MAQPTGHPNVSCFWGGRPAPVQEVRMPGSTRHATLVLIEVVVVAVLVAGALTGRLS